MGLWECTAARVEACHKNVCLLKRLKTGMDICNAVTVFALFKVFKVLRYLTLWAVENNIR